MASKEKTFYGFVISRGIAIGSVYYCKKQKPSIKPSYSLTEQQVEWEIGRFKSAIQKSKLEINRLKSFYSYESQEEEGILSGHLMMLDDPMITEVVENEIRTKKENSASVFEKVVSGYKKRFSEMSDEYFQERADDISDVSSRILHHLSPSNEKKISNAPRGSIVVAESLLPSEVVGISKEIVLGFITKTGGKSSHTAIIAKAKGIPYISGIDSLLIQREKVDFLILDGVNGRVIINPTESTKAEYRKLLEDEKRFHQKIEKERFLQPETIDGYKVSLMGSLDTLDDLEMLSDSCIKGIGLYRSEHLYYKYQRVPTEEEQFEVYSTLTKKMERRDVIIRAFDLEISQLSKSTDDEFSSMSCRAVRALLRNSDIFRPQVRAILRAGAFGNINLLLPMVVDISEFIKAKQIISEEKEKLLSKGVSITSTLKVGAMLEVPASIIMCETIAKEADFLSIGSNDLMQYTLAADRNTSNLDEFYSIIHPSILRLIRIIVSSANRYGKKVILCGELAADTRLTSILLGLGIQYLTVSTRNIPYVTSAIRKLNIVDVYQKTEKAFEYTNAEELMAFLAEDQKA